MNAGPHVASADMPDGRGLMVWLEANRSALYGRAYGLTCNHQDAEDLLQDTYLNIFKSQEPVALENAMAYVATVMRNRAIDRWRSAEHQPKSGGTVADLGDSVILTASEPSPVEQCLSHLDGDELRKTLSKILHSRKGISAETSERDLRAIYLFYYFGLSWAEVGEALGLTEGAAKNRVCKALRAIRENLPGCNP